MEQTELAPSQQLLATHELDGETQLESALVAAFQELGVNIKEKPPLYEVASPQALNKLLIDSEVSVRVSLTVWGYPTVIEADCIRIFEAPERIEE